MINIKSYCDYIIDHQMRVNRAWQLARDKISLTPDEYKEISEAVSKHDDSKWNINEFLAYARHFYNDDPTDDNKTEFDLASDNHCIVNPANSHHYDNRVNARGINKVNFIHMLCDWAAMDVFNRRSIPSKFYENKKDEFPPFGADVGDQVEYLFALFDSITQQMIQEEDSRK